MATHPYRPCRRASRRPRRLAVNIECPHMSRGRERGFATRLRIRAARTAERTDEKAMAEEQMNLQAEVRRLLTIVAHPLYPGQGPLLTELALNRPAPRPPLPP